MTAWILNHLGWLWPLVSAVLTMILRTHTPEEWVLLGEQQPRAQACLKLLRALGVDPVKAYRAILQLLTGHTEDTRGPR